MAATFGRVTDRRKKAPVKRVVVSAEARKAYEDTMREQDKRGRDHTQFLPDEYKGKR
jgi:hypothetical protein